MRYANAGHHARGANGSGALTDLDAVGSGCGEVFHAGPAGDVTGDDGQGRECNAPNTIIQETVRAFNNTWYRDIANNLPEIRNGYAHATTELGCGIKLSNSFLENQETIKKIRSL